MGQKKLKEGEEIMKDPAVIEYLSEASAYDWGMTYLYKGGIRAFPKLLKSIFIEPPEISDEVKPELRRKRRKASSVPKRPIQLDQQYEGYDEKMVLELKKIKFDEWERSYKRGFIENWFFKLDWFWSDAPKELKKLVKKDYILEDPCPDDDDDDDDDES